jgi:hypothetical protein
MRIMLGNGRKAFSTPQQCSSITSFISGILESCLIGVLSHYYVNCFHCSKWAQLTLIRLLTARESFSRSRIERPADEVEKLQKLQGLLRELTHIDLPHSEYYQHEQSLLILREVVLDLEWPKEPQHLSSLLNLQSRSLYTLGCFEHFLWVQHLDLSNNHLRSTHGTIITSPCILATLVQALTPPSSDIHNAHDQSLDL